MAARSAWQPRGGADLSGDLEVAAKQGHQIRMVASANLFGGLYPSQMTGGSLHLWRLASSRPQIFFGFVSNLIGGFAVAAKCVWQPPPSQTRGGSLQNMEMTEDSKHISYHDIHGHQRECVFEPLLLL